MDNLVYEESITSEVSTSEFIDKQFLFVNDNNNSSYSSQIVLDTTPLSNAGGYINWSEAFFAIPTVLQIETTTIANGGGIVNRNVDWSIAMKNGYWSLIHSLTCEFNNGNIIQQVPFINVFNSFKNLTSWSLNDLDDWGATTGFFPDTAVSWVYNVALCSATNNMGTGGSGICNNRIAPYTSVSIISNLTIPPTALTNTQIFAYTNLTPASSSTVRDSYNVGLYKRLAWLNFSLATNDGSAIGNFSSNQASLFGSPTGANLIISTNLLKQTFMSYVDSSIASSRAIVFDAIIRLKDVADFFQKVPLLKGATMRIYLNTNQVYLTGNMVSPSYTAFTATTGGDYVGAGAVFLTAPPTILGGGGTCPLMIGSVDLSQGSSSIVPFASSAAVATCSFKAGVSIVRTQFSQFANQYVAPITSTRLYAPCYTMSPIAEQRYLSLSPTKKVLYNDVFQYSFNGVSSNFNLLVSNGLPNVRGVVVIPFISQSANGVSGGAGVYAGQVATSTILSPFSTSGATPDPIQITNFNIQVSGKNLFLQNLQYTYEQFAEQLVSSNQLNGSLTTSLSSGLIGQSAFENLYRYYYGNVSRSLPSEDGVAKAIQILGTLSTPVAVDLMVFVEFQREITIDVRTGSRIA